MKGRGWGIHDEFDFFSRKQVENWIFMPIPKLTDFGAAKQP